MKDQNWFFWYNIKSILLCTSEQILEFDFPNSQDIHGQKVPEGMYMEKQLEAAVDEKLLWEGGDGLSHPYSQQQNQNVANDHHQQEQKEPAKGNK